MLINIFVALIVIQIFLSLLYKVKHKIASKWFNVSTSLLGLYVLVSYYFIYSFLVDYFIEERNNIDIGSFKMPEIALMVIVVVISHALPCLFYPRKAIVNLLWGLPSYIFYSPTFIITMIVYSFCNFDDVSWGNREDGAD